MYESYYGFTEKPFSLLPDPGFLYLSKKHSTALAMFQYGLLHQAGITVITGEVGSGKTTLIRHVLNEVDDDVTVGLITNTHRSFGELLQWVLLAYDLEHRNMDKVELFRVFTDFLIAEYAKGHRTLLIIDEAQNMDEETLEELRMLSNINADKDQVIQLVLVGQPQLREKLRGPGMEQFAQRISVDYHLEALDPDETVAYIGHRIETAGGDPAQFPVESRRAVHLHCRGIPRLINNLCDMVYVYGFAGQHEVLAPELVNEVARDKKAGGLFAAEAEADA